MALKERKAPDILRGGRGEVTIRFDDDDLVKLPCHCQYDPALCKEEGNEVMVARKIETKNEDGSWSPYPSATWLTDALCSWERNTGRESVLILREVDGFVYRAVNGKPDVPNDVEDAQLMKIIEAK